MAKRERIVGRIATTSSDDSEEARFTPLQASQQLPIAQIEAFNGNPDFMTSLARGLIVLQAFSNLKRPPTIPQLSSKTGISRAAVRRCLYTLAQMGFVEGDDSRRFLLLPKVLSLGYGYLSATPFALAAKPVLERLGRVLRESISISVLDHGEIVYLARASVTRIMSIDLGVGSRLPAFCTSMGRVLLANLPPEELEDYLQKLELRKYTSRTITSLDRLKQILKTVQRNGFAITDQELEEGLRSIAVPVRNPSGNVVAALNAGTQAQRVSMEELRTKFLPELLASAQQIGMLLA